MSELAFNWVQDVALNLWNAGLKEERFHRAGIGFVTEYLVRFEADDQLITENMRRALASFHMRLGETEKVDALYEKWLGHDPQWGWGWIGWSDGYRLDARPPQLERTEALLDRALAVPDLRDELDVLERLQDLYGDQGREDEARSLQARIEALPRARRVRGELPEPFDDGVHEHVETIRKGPKIGRNEPCPCGSGKKYKKCCGR